MPTWSSATTPTGSTAELRPTACVQLPRSRPYNSFVTLADGHLVTKDFAGSRPGLAVAAVEREPSELLVLDPESLAIVDRLVLPEPSIARLSADGDTVYVVGDTSLLVVAWDGQRLVLDADRTVRYRTMEGQGYGWDCVIAGGSAWFLDDGEGSDGYSGTLRGHGVATAPLHLVRIDLATGDLALAEVCGSARRARRQPARGRRRAPASPWATTRATVCWSASTPPPSSHGGGASRTTAATCSSTTSGELVTGDHADVVVLDVATGAERARVDTGSGMQSVLFPCPGWDRDLYLCSFLSITRVSVVSS